MVLSIGHTALENVGPATSDTFSRFIYYPGRGRPHGFTQEQDADRRTLLVTSTFGGTCLPRPVLAFDEPFCPHGHGKRAPPKGFPKGAVCQVHIPAMDVPLH